MITQQLTEKYRPRDLNAFVGQDKARTVLRAFLSEPFPSAWLLVGPPGLGKTTTALAVANQLPAELHHVPARECDLDAVRELLRMCTFAPMRGRWHLALVDEADEMTRNAQVAFLSALDATAAYQPAFLADPLQPESGYAGNTVFVFTANSTDGLERRFLSRCRTLEFSAYGIAQPAAELLSRIWTAEAPPAAPAPDFRRIVKEACNNVRDALNRLEVELMAAPSRRTA